MSEDENFTSIGAILRLGNKTYVELIKEILEDALLKINQTKYKSINVDSSGASTNTPANNEKLSPNEMNETKNKIKTEIGNEKYDRKSSNKVNQ